jgi:hypothetical protein
MRRQYCKLTEKEGKTGFVPITTPKNATFGQLDGCSYGYHMNLGRISVFLFHRIDS